MPKFLAIRDILGIIVLNCPFSCSVALRRVNRTLSVTVPVLDDRFHVPTNGLTLWLDAASGVEFDDGSDHPLVIPRGLGGTTPPGTFVKQWHSVTNHNIILKAAPSLGYGRDKYNIQHEVGDPVWVPNCINNLPAVFFDYGHTGSFTSSIDTRTIISVHSFEAEGRLDHQMVHKYPGELCNFYIFTDVGSFYMHTGGADSGHSFSSISGGGKIRIQGEEAKDLGETGCWVDEGMKLATLQLNGTLTDGITRIGADRDCHQYCGRIAELLVWDRALNEEEVLLVERYLCKKFFPK